MYSFSLEWFNGFSWVLYKVYPTLKSAKDAMAEQVDPADWAIFREEKS